MRNSTLKMTRVLASFVAAGAIIGFSNGAFAAIIDANTVTDNLITSSAGVTDLINLICYVMGTGLALLGCWKLKLHVDNPGQNDLKSALMRLITGGMLLSLPYVMAAMQGSASQGDTTAATVNAVTAFPTP